MADETKLAVKVDNAPAQAPRPKSDQFFFLDVLRAYASGMIVIFHAYSIGRLFMQRQGIEIGPSPLWWDSVIDLFFVMSGFLMVNMSQKLYGTHSGPKIFYAKRAGRTPVLYWLYTIVFAVLFSLNTGTTHGADFVSAERLIDSFTFWPIAEGPMIPLGWTLDFEIFFYLFFGISILFTFPRAPIGLSVFLIALVALGQFVDLSGYYPLLFWTSPLQLNFVWGIALAVLYHYGVRLSDPVRIAVVALCLLPSLMVTEIEGFGNIFRPFSLGLTAMLLVAAATLRRREHDFGKPGRFLSKIGASAYSLYLSHILTLKVVEKIYHYLGLDKTWGVIPYIVIGFLASLAVAYVAYLMLEKPLTAYLSARLRRFAGDSSARPA